MTEKEKEFYEAISQSDESKLIPLISKMKNSELIELRRNYHDQNKKSIFEEIDDKLGGGFKDLVSALLRSKAELDAKNLKDAIEKQDEEVIIEILGSRSSNRISKIIYLYDKINKNGSLEEDLKKAGLNSDLLTLLLKIIGYERSKETSPNSEDCCQKAKILYNRNKEDYFKIFAGSSGKELILISQNYFLLYGMTLQEAISLIFKGSVNKLLNTILISQISQSEYFADKLNESLNSLTTNEQVIIRIMTESKEKSIEGIKKIYKSKYKKDLADDILGKISGDLSELIINMLGNTS